MAPRCGEGTVGPKRQRIVGCVIVVVVLMIAVPVYYHTREDSPVSLPCHIDLSVPLLSPEFHRNGSIVDHGDVYPSGFYFTVNGTTRGCPCALKPCIRKCCAKDEYIVKKPRQLPRCEKNPGTSPFENFSLPVYQSPGKLADVAQDYFRILYGDVCQDNLWSKLTPENPGDRLELMVNGSIHQSNNFSSYRNFSDYCLESVSGSEQMVALVCVKPVQHNNEALADSVINTMYSIGMITSTVCLAVTFLVYSVLPELHNLHGSSLKCHSAVLFTGYLFHTTIKIFQVYFSKLSCTLFAFVTQFSFLASFFWLQVMCFDIWLSFIKTKLVRAEKKKKKFLFYSLYAWGVPVMVVGVSIAMDMTPGLPRNWIKPGFGEVRCWFADNEGMLLYLYLPIAVVVVTNIIMFVSITIKLRAHIKTTKILKTSESRRTRTNQEDRDRFYLYLKLFMIMGITWVMELTSFLVGGPTSVWFIPNLVNSLQGVFIFIIFVCNSRTLKLLNKKLCPQWQIIRDSSTSGTSKVTAQSNFTSDTRIMDKQDTTVLKPLASENEDQNDE